MRGIREISDASRGFGQSAKNGRVYVSIFVNQCDGIDEHLRLLGGCEKLGEFLLAGVVSSVTNDNQRFCDGMAELQVKETFRHGVVEGGATASVDGEDRFGEFAGIVGEWLAAEKFHRNIIVKINDEHLVLRIAGLREGSNRRGNFGKLRGHAAAVVNNQTHSDGSIALLKKNEFLEAAVFIDTEVLLVEPENDIAVCVRNTDGQNNQIRFNGDGGLGRLRQ